MKSITLIVFLGALCTSVFAEVQEPDFDGTIKISSVEMKGECKNIDVISVPKEVIKYYVGSTGGRWLVNCQISAVHTGSLSGKSVIFADIKTTKVTDGSSFTLPDSIRKLTFK